jgi:RimJ/RimL family protein N-acetyltransferase
MAPADTIEAGQVRLRPFRDEDVDDLVAGCSDPLTRRFLPLLPDPYTVTDARRWIGEGSAAASAAGGAAYAIADPDTDRLLGGVGLSRVDPERLQGEIGYWVGPWARGRGVATAATIAIAGWAFGRGLVRLEVLATPENTPSQRVALAAGFRPEGVRRGGAAGRDGARHDLTVWARLVDDPIGPVVRRLPDLPGGRLTDGVVTLRPLLPSDGDAMFELHTVPDVVASGVPPVTPDRAEIDLRCSRAQARWLVGERADLVITDAVTGATTGEIGLYYQEPQTGQAMIGYSMLPAWRGRGYPARAARLVAAWAFEHVGLARIIAGTNPTNVRSQRVLEGAGFQREGYLRSRLPGMDGTRIDDVQYSLIPADLHTPASGEPVRPPASRAR